MGKVKSKVCPICGETDPEPAWFCMDRATGIAEPGQPCHYSVEGDARMRDKLEAELALVSPDTGGVDGER